MSFPRKHEHSRLVRGNSIKHWLVFEFRSLFFQSLETVGAQPAEEDESRATEVLEVFNLFSSIFRGPIYFSVCALREYYWEQSRTLLFCWKLWI